MGEIVIGKEVSIWSAILDEKRTLKIYTPPGYLKGAEDYPVLYLLDGRHHFHHTTGVVDYLTMSDRFPKMIVVAVTNTDRSRDLTPSPGEMAGKQMGGGGDNFLKFLADELIPWVETEYSTRPYRILIGHSFGGLFGVHALTTRPDLFQGIIAISPSVWWDDNYAVHAVEKWLESKPQTDNAIYITMGNEGGEAMEGANKVAEMLKSNASSGLRARFVHMPLESHLSVPHRSTQDGLEFIFEGWSLLDPLAVYDAGGWEAIEDHYRTIRSKFGYEPYVPLKASQDLLGAFAGATPSRLHDALVFIKELDDEAYGISPEAFHMLASMFVMRGDTDGEKRSYQLCLERFPSDQMARIKLMELGEELPPSLEQAQ